MSDKVRTDRLGGSVALMLEPEEAEQGNHNGADREWSRLGPVSVILPSFNEESAVRQQVDAIRRVLTEHQIVHEIIVVDDGSTDGTAAEANAARARVLRHQCNRGYGASIKTGMLAAKYDQIVISDADGTYPVEAIPMLLTHLELADMVVAARTGHEVHIPWERRPGKWFIGRLAVLIAGQQIPDLNSGLRAFRRACVMQYFPILSNRFSFTTTSTLALLADNYRVIYVPINYHRRIGKSKITPRHFMDFTILILRISMMFQPLKIFLPLAFTFLGLGALKVAFDIWSLFVRNEQIGFNLVFYPVLSTSAILLLVTGIQSLFIGMLADAIVRRIVQHNVPVVSSQGRTLPEVPLSHVDEVMAPHSRPSPEHAFRREQNGETFPVSRPGLP